MDNPYFNQQPRRVLFAFAALACATLAGCETTQELRRANLQQDADTCVDYGTRYGSAQHTDCMLVQQNRRDNEAVNALEKQRLSAEIAKTNVEMLERRRCEKEAKRDRDEGRRPRPCR